MPVEDGSESPYTWGALNDATRLSTPQRIPVRVELQQDFEGTRIVVQPQAGGFPENALVVLSRNVDALQRSIPKLAQSLNVRLLRVEPLDESLESVFSYLVEA